MNATRANEDKFNYQIVIVVRPKSRMIYDEAQRKKKLLHRKLFIHLTPTDLLSLLSLSLSTRPSK